MNKKMVLRMCFNKEVISNLMKIYDKFKLSPNYKLINMVKAGRHMIRNDRIVKHNGKYMIHSFLPPVNSKAFLNMAMKVPGSKGEFFENYVQGKRSAPISTYIAVTNKCMYKCWHCSASKFMERSGSEYTTLELISAVKSLQDLGVSIIGFTGGEPLLRKDLESVIKNINPTSTSYVFTTGFSLTPERALSLKKSGLFGIAISVDSLSSKVHDSLRGYIGAKNIAIEAIKNAKRAGLYTMSQTVGTKELIETGEIYKLALFLKSIGVDEMRIMEPIPSGNLKENEQAILKKNAQEKLKEIHITMNHNKKYPKAAVFPYFESSENFGCGAGSQHSYLDSKGNFGPCDFVDEFYGNILEEDIHKVWATIHKAVGKPKCSCIAKNCVNNKNELPDFYKILGGKIITIKR